MTEDKKKFIAEPAFIIDLGCKFSDIRKSVNFIDGVGVCDYDTIGRVALAQFDFSGKYARPFDGAVTITPGIIADYFDKQGAKVTKITEPEAAKLKVMIVKGEKIQKKYLYDIPEPVVEEEKEEKIEKTELENAKEQKAEEKEITKAKDLEGGKGEKKGK